MTAAVAPNGLPGNGGPDHKSMLSYFDRIDTLTTQPESEADFSREVTRKHWKPADGVNRCTNRACRKQFSLLERSHHCRKCGEVFCAGCLQYQRKLNQLAHFDPLQGRSYKVCKTCYEEGTTADGRVRNLTSEFTQMRLQSLGHKSTGSRGGGEIRAGEGRRNQVNFDQECQRLLEGFKFSMGGKSEFRRTLHEMRNVVSMPSWHKSSIWLTESIAETCRICCQTFGLLRKRHHCKVCGLALCKSCSTLDLLVYVPNSQIHSDTGQVLSSSDLEAILAIIKIVGCPDVEPEMSMYLRVCRACRDALIQQQLKRLNGDEAPSRLEMLEELFALHSRFSVAELNVNSQLRDYQDIVESLENNTRSSNPISSAASTVSVRGEGGGGGSRKGGTKGTVVPPHSNMRTLAKAQEDLTDFLAQHVLVVQRLKRLVPRSEPQSRLLKNYIRAKCDYYMENMSTFRRLKKKFEESSPPEVLEFIRRIMDKDAIISAHLYLRQLVYESIRLCDKHELQEKSPEVLISLEQVIEKEVTECLQREGEDVDQHMELMKEMIRTQMKDHKLIRPSRQSVSKHGRTHVQHIMSMRIREVLDQVTLQLRFKSANRSFPKAKQALGQTIELLAAG